MNENWFIKIVDRGFKVSREIFIFRKKYNGKMEILRANGETEEFDFGAQNITPTLDLYPETLQALANALSEIGYKPQQGFVEGEIVATKKHLEDLRSIVFKK